MKLVKLLVLFPAFAMIACVGNNQPASSEEPKGPEYEVTEQVFNEQINKCDFLKPDDNKTMICQSEVDGLYKVFELEMDGGKFHGEMDGKEFFVNTKDYEKDTDTYTIDFYSKSGVWKVEEQEGVTTRDLALAAINWFPCQFEFGDFDYDKEEKAYTAKSISTIIEGHPLTFTNIVLKFEDGMFQNITLNMPFDGEEGTLTYKTTKQGKTSVTLPIIE